MARLYASNLRTIEAIREGCKRNRGSIHKFSQRIEEHNLLLVIRSVEGTSVNGGKYSEEDAKFIVRQILSIMAFCHIQGVVHRDLKPENFLFTTKDEHAPMKAIDFGLSDFIRPDERLNDIVGSTYYVAPEVLHRSYRMGANVWSVGVITYILLCGSRPFWARTESGIFRAVLRADPNFDDAPWPSVSPDAKDFVKRLLNKTCAQALTHPWLRGQHAIPLDILIFRLVKVYIRASPLKQAALKEMSKSLTENELFYLRSALMRNSTEAMKESKVLDILNSMEHIASRKMDFEEFCAAAISIYQLEALDQWEKIASSAYEFFEHEGNKVISVEELAREMNLAPTAHIVLQDWIRSTDGKLGFHGFTKFLHGVAVHSKYQASINASQIEKRNLLLMIHSIEGTFISVGKVEVLVSRYGLFLCDFPEDIWLHIYRNIMGSSKLDGSPAAPDGKPFSLSF